MASFASSMKDIRAKNSLHILWLQSRFLILIFTHMHCEIDTQQGTILHCGGERGSADEVKAVLIVSLV